MITAKLKKRPVLKAVVTKPYQGKGYADGYADGLEKGYTEGETAATEAAEAHNAEILTDCNSVLPTKGASTAETLEQVPQRIGEIKSYDEGYDVGLKDGKQAEYDAFWDVYQQNGNRTNYQLAFYGLGWTDTTFKPKYDIKPTGSCSQIFQQAGITDLKGICETQGITFDFSGVTSTSNPFENSKITRMPTYNLTGLPNCATALRGLANLVWVDKVVLKNDGTQTFGTGTGYFLAINSNKLEHCPIEGKIGTNFWFLSSVLDAETIQSVIDALMDLTGATAQTVTFHRTVGNKLTEAQKATITAKNWTLVY